MAWGNVLPALQQQHRIGPWSQDPQLQAGTQSTAAAAAPRPPQDSGWANLDMMALMDRRRVGEQYGNIGNQLAVGLSKRGMSRSGFAQEGMAGVHGEELGALADAGTVDASRRQQYQMELDQQAAQRAADAKAKKARKRKKKKRWLGGALSALAVVAAPFTGGASLLALPATVPMATQ